MSNQQDCLVIGWHRQENLCRACPNQHRCRVPLGECQYVDRPIYASRQEAEDIIERAFAPDPVPDPTLSGHIFAALEDAKVEQGLRTILFILLGLMAVRNIGAWLGWWP